jgi:hypothetical protein
MKIKESIAWTSLDYMCAFMLSEITYGNLSIRVQINAKNRQEITKHSMLYNPWELFLRRLRYKSVILLIWKQKKAKIFVKQGF